MAASSRSNDSRMTVNQTLALILGATYTLVGIAGFAVTGFDDFAGRDTQETLLGFELNGLHNLAHIALGLFGLAMFRRHDTARAYGWILFGAYAPLFLFGLYAAGNTDVNFLSINGADNGLHLATALAGLFVALKKAPIDLRDREDVHEDTSAGTRQRTSA